MVYYPINWEESLKKECKRRRYSIRTAESYITCINKFLNWTNKSIDRISKKDVREYLNYLSDKELAGSTINVNHMALRFLFEQVLEKRMWIDIKYSKVPERVQRVLSKEEIRTLLNKIENWKHRLMIETIYSSGLRLSELINLKVKDLVFDKGYGFVRNGKGGKDRIIVLSKIVNDKVKNLIDMEKLNGEDFIFLNNKHKIYNQRTIQQIVKNASKKAGFEEVHPHTLRHSFATHLIENGYSVSDVQAMLGHKSPETSMIYIHSAGEMTKIKSPFDK